MRCVPEMPRFTSDQKAFNRVGVNISANVDASAVLNRVVVGVALTGKRLVDIQLVRVNRGRGQDLLENVGHQRRALDVCWAR